jgi:thioredoxin-dependent peroxiredoxin
MQCSTITRALPFVAGIAASTLHAQQAATPKEPEPLQVGAVAPDFTLPGATRYGALKAPIHLSDFKGKTVVLAFFFKARTKG